MAEELIKDCLEKTCRDERRKHLIYQKLGLKLEVLKTQHAFITIQFHSKILQKYFIRREKEESTTFVNELLSYAWLKNNDYIYNLEFNSEKYLNNDNPHCHLLIVQGTTRLNKSKIIRDIKSRYKENLKVVNYQSSNSQIHYLNRKNYITGVKVESKTKYQILDETFRTKHGLKKYYTNIQCQPKDHTNAEPPSAADLAASPHRDADTEESETTAKPESPV